MRLGPKFLTLLSLILAGAGAYLSAMAAAGMVERVSERAVKTELQVDGYDWVSVETDGLQVILTGTAPTEASRLRAIASAGQVIDATRVRDGMDVLDAAPIAAPRFSVELLRNDSGISLMGLIPASVDRQGLVAELSALARPEPVSDLLSIADYPVPEGWQDALDYAIKALENLPRSKVSIAAGSVQIKAISGSREEKRRLEDDLTRRAPDSVRLALNISAPRPVITPFTLRFASDPEDGIAPRFDACSADTEAARGRILTAARKVGLEGKGDCTLGLGVPTPDWATAAEQAIAAVGELGGGSVTISDVDIALVALPSTPQAQFDRVVGELESNLPEVFSLTPVLPKETGSDNTADGPPEFVATRSPEGQVQIRGRIKDANTRSMIESFARARFGTEAVHTAARTDESLPTDWSVRVLAGLQALALVHNGSLTIQPDFLSVRGTSGKQDASDEIARILSDKLGETQNFDIAVSYNEALDPLADLPTAPECIARINLILENQKITFEPGKTEITGSAVKVLDDIAEVFKACRKVEMEVEISGHTDSQGREEMNAELSQRRADAVLAGLLERRVRSGRISAVGFGEAQPIADNETEDGREANRRIEFRLVNVPVPELVATDETAEASTESAETTQGAPGPSQKPVRRPAQLQDSTGAASE